ncbi:MAG: hypothetical protein H7289_00145 [Mucilaginibacter sp.]|nr:hypothetical protein [Mucilaginibacter sp.]
MLTAVCVFMGCSVTVAQKTDLSAKAKKLKQLYLLVTKSTNSEIYEEQFFNEFPNTFKELNELYGYEKDKPAPLYYDGLEHIYELFNNLKSINDTLYYKKIVSIAKGARYDADAVSYFQSGLRDKVLANPKLILFILKNKPEKEVIGFWSFYFDYENSSARKKNYIELIKKIPAQNKNSIRFITAGYEKSTKYWTNSH